MWLTVERTTLAGMGKREQRQSLAVQCVDEMTDHLGPRPTVVASRFIRLLDIPLFDCRFVFYISPVAPGSRW